MNNAAPSTASSGASTADTLDALLRERAVRQLTGLGRSTRWRMMAEGRFPQAVRIGTRWTAWRASDIRAWLASLSSETKAAK